MVFVLTDSIHRGPIGQTTCVNGPPPSTTEPVLTPPSPSCISGLSVCMSACTSVRVCVPLCQWRLVNRRPALRIAMQKIPPATNCPRQGALPPPPSPPTLPPEPCRRVCSLLPTPPLIHCPVFHRVHISVETFLRGFTLEFFSSLVSLIGGMQVVAGR